MPSSLDDNEDDNEDDKILQFVLKIKGESSWTTKYSYSHHFFLLYLKLFNWHLTVKTPYADRREKAISCTQHYKHLISLSDFKNCTRAGKSDIVSTIPLLNWSSSWLWAGFLLAQPNWLQHQRARVA